MASAASLITPLEQLDRLFGHVSKGRYRDSKDEADALKPISDWFFALRDLDSLPEKIPLLPLNIYQILEGPCPFSLGKRVCETHLLALVPEEFKTLGLFVERVEEISLRIQLFDDTRRLNCKNEELQYGPMHWVLVTKNGISGEDDYSSQNKVIAGVNKQFSVSYEPLSLVDMITTLFFRCIRKEKVSVNSFVQDEKSDCRLIVKGRALGDGPGYKIQISAVRKDCRIRGSGLVVARKLDAV